MHCRVCGLLQDEPIWGDDGECPTFNICACCGCEFGTEDSSSGGVTRHRASWVATGVAWFDPSRTPADWSRDEQLEHSPSGRASAWVRAADEFTPTFGGDSPIDGERIAEAGSVEAQCPYCGETTQIWIDCSGGSAQTFVEDCIVCCRPLLVRMQGTGDAVAVSLERTD